MCRAAAERLCLRAPALSRGMAMRPRACLLALPALLLAASAGRADTPANSVGKKIARFTLKDSDGKPRTLADFRDSKAVVVLFIGTQCPINNAFMPRLAEL